MQQNAILVVSLKQFVDSDPKSASWALSVMGTLKNLHGRTKLPFWALTPPPKKAIFGVCPRSRFVYRLESTDSV